VLTRPAVARLCPSLPAPACLLSCHTFGHVFPLQYYFETIFPRIPKKVEDDIQAELRRQGLPTKGKGNGGCGGPDRRGGDSGNQRPASVKASLSVAFGQRAPNRAGTKAWKDERIKAVGGGDGRSDKGPSRDRSRDPSRDPTAAGADERRGYGRSRSGSRERPRGDRPYGGHDSRDRNGRDYDSSRRVDR
jgi:pre-mRNA-splicing factor 38B